MTNVQEALKAAIRFARINPHVGMYENSNSNHVVYGAELAKTFEAALSDIEKCEPVAEVTAQWVIDFIGSNYNSMRTHDEQGNELLPDQITYSLTVHDLLSAFAYTSPISKEFVWLTDDEIVKIYGHTSLVDWTVVDAIEAKIKQLNSNV